MKDTELKGLACGSVLQHRHSGNGYIVVGYDEYGWPIVRREITATNPDEWTIIRKAPGTKE